VAELWQNWAREQRCAPETIERPGSEDDLVAAIRRAVAAGRRVRAAGSGHSFTDIACTDGVLLDLGRMRRVIDADRASGLVRIEAGVTLHELGKELAAWGLAMENQGDIDRQTLAGAISTGTHGTGARFANLSSQVAAVRLITASGDALELSMDSDSDGLLAARVGLGALGAISQVTLRCVPLFTVRRVDEPRPLRRTLAGLDELAVTHDHFEFYAFPYTDVAFVRLSERGDMPPDPVDPRKLWVQEVLLENRAIDLAGRLGRSFPRLIPGVNRGFARLVGRHARTDHGYRIYASRRDVKFTEMEYAVPREHGVEAVERVLALVERRRLPVGFPIEVRVVAGDDAFLSTAHGRDTLYVAVHQYHGMEFEAYFRGVERIMDDYGGRPHWGKRHYQSAATLRPRYPEWDRFQAVRARLDPGGTFQNDYTERVLGPVGAPVAA
jgi:L-gulono-1,4-lactone dehydrogenase